MPTTYEAALEYVNRGYSVIPLRPRSKTPLLDWKPYQTRKPTEAELRQWFQNTENNIGIVTGQISNLFVVDADSYKDTFSVALDSMYPTEMQVRTRNDGQHFYYDTNGHDLRNFVGDNALDGRGEGGYVVAPPSMVPKDDGELGTYQWIKAGTPSKLPDDWVQEYQKPVLPEIRIAGDDAINLLEKVMLNGFSKGQHNTQLRDLSRLLSRTTANPELAQQVSRTILKVLDLQDETPQSAENNFDPTFLQGWNYEQQRIKSNAVSMAASERVITSKTIRELMAIPPPVLIFEDGMTIKEKALTLIVGQRNNGKTFFMQHAAMTMARNGYKVVYIRTEDSPYYFAGRLLSWMKTHQAPESVLDNFTEYSVDIGNIWQLAEKSDVDHLIETVGKCDALFFDPLIEFTQGQDEQSAQAMAPIMSSLHRIKRELGCTVVVSHHAGKDASKGARGSSAIEGSADTVLSIQQEDSEDSIIAKCTKERNGMKPSPVGYKIVQTEDGHAALSNSVSVDELSSSEVDGRERLIYMSLSEGASTIEQLEEETGIPRSSIYRYCNRLVAKGKLVKDGANRYTLPTEGVF